MIIDRLVMATATDDDTGKNDLSRRTLLKAGLASGGGLLLSMRMPMLVAHAAAPPADFNKRGGEIEIRVEKVAR